MKSFMLPLIAATSLAIGSFAHGQDIYCQITSQTIEDLVPVMAVSGGVDGNYDLATGLATGRHQHLPLTIIKVLDAISPRLFKAAVLNENLDTVECSFYRLDGPDRGGGAQKLQLYFKITMEDARIVDIAIGNQAPTSSVVQEAIQFVFQKIIIEDVISGTLFEDTWGNQSPAS
jgi:type VI secretion system secreted protein Hcp